MVNWIISMVNALGTRGGISRINLGRLRRRLTRATQVTTAITAVLTIVVLVIGSTVVDGDILLVSTAIAWLAILAVGWWGFTQQILDVFGLAWAADKAWSLFSAKGMAEAIAATEKPGAGESHASFMARLESVALEVVTDLRKGIGNVAWIASMPFLVAVWGYLIDFRKTDVIAPLAVALVMFFLGKMLAPGVRRTVLILGAIGIFVGVTVYATVTNEKAPLRMGIEWVADLLPEDKPVQAAASTTTTTIPYCPEEPKLKITSPEPGVTEYRIGPLGGRCVTQIFGPEPGWDGAKVTVMDFASQANIQHIGGPASTLRCQDSRTTFSGQWPNFRITDGEGYLLIVTWKGVPEPPYLCDAPTS